MQIDLFDQPAAHGPGQRQTDIEALIMEKDGTVWVSAPRKIGKHEWRIRQYMHDRYGIVMTYEWRGPNAPHYYPAEYWHDHEEWPTYNSDNGTTAGCPASLRKLWEDNRAQMDANKALKVTS